MSTPLPQPPARLASRRQRGVTLIEALVALLVMSFGMLALVGLMSNLRRSADLAKQRSEAMRIARAEITKLRNFSELSRAASTPASSAVYAEITSAAASAVTLADSNTTYEVEHVVTNLNDIQAKQVRVKVNWTDRAGTAQFVNLDTIIASVDPVFSVALGFTPANGAVTQPSARHPTIPTVATKLDPSISIFRPSSSNATVWIFNNLTGVVTGKCSIDPAIALTSLTVADIESCKNATVGYLLSGVIRFSNTSPPNPTVPEGTAIPLGLDFQAGSYDMPRLDAAGNPIRDASGVILTDSFTATPPTPTGGAEPNYECFTDAPASAPSLQPFVNYYCLVFRSSGSLTWSGKVVLTGFATGTTAAERRVCRYSADYNGSGDMYTGDKKALDNTEHPAVYGRVNRSLSRQNFLVVRGDQNCPTAPTIDPSAGVFADYSTLQLQP